MNLQFAATLLSNRCPKLHSKKSLKQSKVSKGDKKPDLSQCLKDFNFSATKYLMFLPTALLGFQIKQLEDK